MVTRTRGSSLISMLVITIVAVVVIVAMVALTGAITLSMGAWKQSGDALMAAESVADDMMVRMLIDPSTTPAAGEYIGFPNATGYPFLTPGVYPAPNTVIAKGISGLYIRAVKVQYTFDAEGKLIIVSRQQSE